MEFERSVEENPPLVEFGVLIFGEKSLIIYLPFPTSPVEWPGSPEM